MRIDSRPLRTQQPPCRPLSLSHALSHSIFLSLSFLLCVWLSRPSVFSPRLSLPAMPKTRSFQEKHCSFLLVYKDQRTSEQEVRPKKKSTQTNPHSCQKEDTQILTTKQHKPHTTQNEYYTCMYFERFWVFSLLLFLAFLEDNSLLATSRTQDVPHAPIRPPTVSSSGSCRPRSSCFWETKFTTEYNTTI